MCYGEKKTVREGAKNVEDSDDSWHMLYAVNCRSLLNNLPTLPEQIACYIYPKQLSILVIVQTKLHINIYIIKLELMNDYEHIYSLLWLLWSCTV